MVDVSKRLDEIDSNIMSGLKDFQKATVERIDSLYRSGQTRVLVSDEVGLGKTLIARGVISKLAKMRKENGDKLVKVVYICSNAAIAEQNLNKLKISRELKAESTGSARLSMQHLNIAIQENDKELLGRYIQLIPLTPDTSFRMTNGTGIAPERALMFTILKRIPEFKPFLKELEVAMIDWASSQWFWWKTEFEKRVSDCDKKSDGEYLKNITQKVSDEIFVADNDGITLFDELKELFSKIRRNGFNRVNENSVIGKLRVVFAKISLDNLEPDLVIMDEFQRFKYLINSDPESETGMLANKFFNSSSVRMLLLSATPYKMYSTLEEIDETQVDEHYSEFLDVMNFLNVKEDDRNSFRTIWSDYSVRLKELTNGDTTIITAKNAAENAMYRNVCRTERISAVEGADMVNDSSVKSNLKNLEQDIKSYLQMQKLLETTTVKYNVPVDYVKSSPYLMSFMRDYVLKKDIEKYFKENKSEIGKLKKETFWLNRSKLSKYEKIPSSNARLDDVMQRVFEKGAEKLLWVPPSRPYYPSKGAFKDTDGFTKTLVFSSWEMVPRMLSCMLSYEAERKTVGVVAKTHHDKDGVYFYSGSKRYPHARLTFSEKGDTASAMTLFTLLYPSKFLADSYDPIDCMNRGLSLSQIKKEIEKKLSEKLDKIDEGWSRTEDKRWYYIAPMLLDGEGYVTTWLENGKALAVYDEEDEKSKKQKGFLAHIEALRANYREAQNARIAPLGRKPKDLLDVLSTMAIASPAICAYRTYRRYSPFGIRSFIPSQIAKVFINRMNTPEATAVIELCYGKSDEAHWKNLLSYCADGNFQAMFDEYAHLISNGLDKDDNLVEHMHRLILESMDIRTTLYSIDTLKNFDARINGKKEKAVNMRAHFAVAFTKGDGGSKDSDRKKTVRNSFNSPFRPFVLSSTSIGQEGLDFHNYCRRIVHWNLPSNPIDLEQREGRINRFECLAIRQNIAKRYGKTEFKKDIWTEMFNEAVTAEKTKGCSDLIPFWGLTETPDMVKIERIVPMYPFSRDVSAYERLIKILSLYRLTLGQARQEELLEYIFNNIEDTDEIKDLFINLSPFYKSSKKE